MKNVLANWQYSGKEWRRFVAFEKGEDVKATYNPLKKDGLWTIGILIFINILFGTQFGLYGLLGANAAFFGFALFLWLVWRARKYQQMSRLDAGNGAVRLTVGGVTVNGLTFDWNFDGNWSRLVSIERRAAETPSGTLDYLYFRCVTRVKTHVYQSDPPKVYKELRVPIPEGKIAEADAAVQQIYAARNSFVQRKAGDRQIGHLYHEGGPEHDFTDSKICLKCGTGVENATLFGTPCRN